MVAYLAMALVTSLHLLQQPLTLQVSTTKPRLVFHAGPRKMGTTYLQEVLTTRAMEKLLGKDGFVFLGRYSGWRANRPNFFRWHDGYHPFIDNTTAFKPEFNELRDHLRESSVLIVAEGTHGLTDEQFRHLSEYFHRWWHVQVILAYRPFYDWLPSNWNQLAKYSVNRWVWPNKKGKNAIQPIPLEMDPLLQSIPWHQHFTNERIEQVSDMLHVIPTIMDLSRLPASNGTDPLLTAFLCDTVRLEHSCQALLSGRLVLPYIDANPSYPIVYDAIAVDAHQQGYLRHCKRPAAIALVRQYHETHLNRTLADLPYTCPSRGTQEALLNRTVAVEEGLFGLVSVDRMAWHRQRIANKKELCNVNAKLVLADEGWIAFFRNVSQEPDSLE